MFRLPNFVRSPEDGTGSDAPMSSEGMRDLLAFDPFSPPATNGTEGEAQGQAPAEGSPQPEAKPEGGEVKPGVAAEPSPSPEPPEGQAPKAGEPSLEDLRAQVANLLAKTTPTQEPAQKEAPKVPSEAVAQAPQAEAAKYNFQLPDHLVNDIRSDEPAVAKAALSSLVNSMMNTIVRDFSGALTQIRDELKKSIPQEVLGQVEAQRTTRSVQEDFYSAWPELHNVVKRLPAMEASLWETIKTTANNTKQTSWTPEFRDQVGAMLHLQLGIPIPQGKLQQQAAPQAVPARTPARAPFSAGSSAQPRANGASPQDDFLAVLGAGM